MAELYAKILAPATHGLRYRSGLSGYAKGAATHSIPIGFAENAGESATGSETMAGLKTNLWACAHRINV